MELWVKCIDPRTGEIIKGHVSLGSLRIRQDFMIAQSLSKDPYKYSDENDIEMLNMSINRIKQLSAHEIGHTLGLPTTLPQVSTIGSQLWIIRTH